MYYLMLDADAPPGAVLRYVRRNNNKSVLQAIASYDPAEMQSIPWAAAAPARIEDHPLRNVAAPGNPVDPAGIYDD